MNLLIGYVLGSLTFFALGLGIGMKLSKKTVKYIVQRKHREEAVSTTEPQSEPIDFFNNLAYGEGEEELEEYVYEKDE